MPSNFLSAHLFRGISYRRFVLVDNKGDAALKTPASESDCHDAQVPSRCIGLATRPTSSSRGCQGPEVEQARVWLQPRHRAAWQAPVISRSCTDTQGGGDISDRERLAGCCRHLAWLVTRLMIMRMRTSELSSEQLMRALSFPFSSLGGGTDAGVASFRCWSMYPSSRGVAQPQVVSGGTLCPGWVQFRIAGSRRILCRLSTRVRGLEHGVGRTVSVEGRGSPASRW